MTLSSRTVGNDRYILPGDDAERQRLVRQSNVVKAALGGNSIIAPINYKIPLLVLDAGTGPGAWIEDASKLLHPHSILHGIDINETMFPTVRPFNTSFSVTSVLDLPDGWSNRFDFVHQRLLVWALSADEWRESIVGSFRVLHPGGWMQVAEPGRFEGGGEYTARMWKMMREVLASRNLRADIVLTAPDLFQEVGFTNITSECFYINLGKWAGEIGSHGSESLRGAFRSMKPLVLHLGGLGMTDPGAEFDELVDGLEREWDACEGMRVELRVIYGQKQIGRTINAAPKCLL